MMATYVHVLQTFVLRLVFQIILCLSTYDQNWPKASISCYIQAAKLSSLEMLFAHTTPTHPHINTPTHPPPPHHTTYPHTHPPTHTHTHARTHARTHAHTHTHSIHPLTLSLSHHRIHQALYVGKKLFFQEHLSQEWTPGSQIGNERRSITSHMTARWRHQSTSAPSRGRGGDVPIQR